MMCFLERSKSKRLSSKITLKTHLSFADVIFVSEYIQSSYIRLQTLSLIRFFKDLPYKGSSLGLPETCVIDNTSQKTFVSTT